MSRAASIIAAGQTSRRSIVSPETGGQLLVLKPAVNCQSPETAGQLSDNCQTCVIVGLTATPVNPNLQDPFALVELFSRGLSHRPTQAQRKPQGTPFNEQTKESAVGGDRHHLDDDGASAAK